MGVAKRWLFRAHQAWRRGWVDAERAKRCRNQARARLEQWKANNR